MTVDVVGRSPAGGARPVDGRESSPPRTFRPEIEGLRAVAALLVAVYHIFLGRVSGGVDVFFVVAGFLITTTLVGHGTRFGRVRVGSYLARLASRLLPAALVVLSAVLVGMLLWFSPIRRQAGLQDVVASALYVENWLLASRSVDYLARDAPASPLQHFWALSIQGQFYVIWLVLLTVVLAVFTRVPLRRRLAVALGLIFVASLAFSIHLTAANQPLAYFHTGTRVWEFAAGGLLAVTLHRLPSLPDVLLAVAGWVGLAMIVTGGLLLPVSTSFPGWVALWPVVGALLVVSCGPSTHRFASSRLLGSAGMVALGGISYALYLWHWPLLIAYRTWHGPEPVALGPGLAILAVSVVLAWVTTHGLEKPIRRWLARLSPWRTVAVGVLGIAIVAGTAVALAQRPVEDTRTTEDGVTLDLAAAAKDLSQLNLDDCQQSVTAAEVIVCEYGDPQGRTTVFLVGGSHSTHWFPALNKVGQRHGWRILTATKASCRFSADGHEGDAAGRSCAEWNRDVLAEVIAERPDLVVTTATVAGTRGKPEVVPSGYVTWWRELAAEGIPVAAIRDNPMARVNRIECLDQHGPDGGECDIPRSQSLLPENPAAHVAGLPDTVSLIDMTDAFCDESTCPAVIDGMVVYTDSQHLSRTFSESLAPELEDQLRSSSAGIP